ncbi:MAG: anaerobic ribonucleoside-triphosphate reductase activating protein [Erysipelotrichales bacterium]|nr:anaerobic ribonucleoside-triphosphate reductase activating protein [Erysipelotrichales bacterium]
MRISGIVSESIVDGPGIRFVIFTQGCSHACKECHNQETWNPNGGKEISVKELKRQLRNKKNIRGVTFSGGEPFQQAEELAELATYVKAQGWDIFTYSGFTYEELAKSDDVNIQKLLYLSDFLVDGLFVKALADIRLKFRGSSNQRIIDLNRSRIEGKIIVWGDE